MSKLMDLAQGNLGALQVLTALANDHEYDTIEAIERDGLRGADIWVAFKDYAGGDRRKMGLGIEQQDPALWDLIRKERGTK